MSQHTDETPAEVSANLRINGVVEQVRLGPATTVLQVLRDQLGLTGTKQGCDDCECGACMVLIDDRPVNSCSYLAAQGQGRQITTIEGLAPADGLHRIQAAILEAAGVQCGFCTPGMLMSAKALLAKNPNPTRDEIAIGLSGNLCRCTGYARIIEAVQRVL